jgi:hypothetical protein
MKTRPFCGTIFAETELDQDETQSIVPEAEMRARIVQRIEADLTAGTRTSVWLQVTFTRQSHEPSASMANKEDSSRGISQFGQ